METKSYYSQGNEKKRLLADDHLDSQEFDFLQNFASDIDELQQRASGHAETCLSVVNNSSGRKSNLIRPVSELRDA